MKNIVDSLYDYDCSGVNDEESSAEEELQLSLKLINQTSQSHGSWSVKTDQYTDSSSEEEDLNVDVNFDDPIDLAIN